jgi:hypothetical protein
MTWTKEQQTLFDNLRKKELTGLLSVEEKSRLNDLRKTLEGEETRLISPGLDQLHLEQKALNSRLKKIQKENEELAKLLFQQEQLVTDARNWLAQFEKRHRVIQSSYERLTGEKLSVYSQ